MGREMGYVCRVDPGVPGRNRGPRRVKIESTTCKVKSAGGWTKRICERRVLAQTRRIGGVDATEKRDGLNECQEWSNNRS